MVEVKCQFDGKVLRPYSAEDHEALSNEYKRNQLVTCRVTTVGTALAQAVEQTNLVYKCFELVADSSPNPQHNTKDNVKMAAKIGIDFRDPNVCFVRPDGGVQLGYRSLNYRDLKGQERNEVMQRLLEWCADIAGLTVDQLVAEAKSRMRR